MVEVDVREQEVPEVLQLEAACAQALLQPRQGRRRPAVEEGRAVPSVEQVDADRALGGAEVEVDRLGLRHPPILRFGRGGPGNGRSMSETQGPEADQAAEAATEGDAAWRARTQEQEPAPADVPQPPPPAGIDPGDNHP